MDENRILYFSFLFIGFVLSLCCKKSEKGLHVFPYLLGFSVVTEALTVILSHYKVNYFFVYHIFIPVDYTLWSIYFYLNSGKKNIRKIILFIIPVFVITSITFSFTVVNYEKFPNLQLNIEGLLLVIWATIAIFTIEIKNDSGIFSRPVFWVCVAVLVYFSAISSFMGMFNFISRERTDLIVKLQFYLLNVPNYILYSCLSIAFICSQVKKK